MNLTLSRLWRRPPTENPGVDYRDRISVATWVVVFGLGVSLLLEIPTTQITFRALGSPITLSLSAGNVMALLLAVAAAAGTESIVRLHPRFPRRRRSATWAYWALPMAIASITVVLLPQVPTRLLQVIVMLVAGGLLAVALYSLYASPASRVFAARALRSMRARTARRCSSSSLSTRRAPAACSRVPWCR